MSTRLCDRCSNISFTPLSQTPYSFRRTASAEVIRKYQSLLFYFHHCCIPCIAGAGQDGKCRLCAFLMAKWHMSQKSAEADELCAALNLPGAGVWVILTQRPGAMATTSDGRRFRGRRKEENWDAGFTFHYDKIAFPINLAPLPDPYKDIFLTCPPKEADGMRREDDPAWLAVTTKLARAWYDECTRPRSSGGYHVDCLTSHHPEGGSFMPRRLILVGLLPWETPRIVEAGQAGKYLTLSYCWGDTQKLKLTKSNLESLKKSLPVGDLSLTIQDAIKVTRQLGFRYLWVDALCIVQDDDNDKATQLPLMSDIYKRSEITIAAAIGLDADAGLFPPSRPGWWRPCPVYSEARDDGTKLPLFAVIPGNARQLAGQRSPLDSRAWIFQEDILATRTLKFCPEGIRWSCITFCMSEANPSKPEFHPSFRTDNNLRTWVHQPDWKPNWHETLDPRRRYFEDWYAAVSHYTVRRIKFSSDRLPALAGLARWMQTLRGGTYVQGLWKEDLEYGLLWFATKPRDDRDQGDIYLQDVSSGDEHYRVMPASGAMVGKSIMYPDARATAAAPPTKFLDQFTPALAPLVVAGSRANRGIPSWTWAAADQAEIEFLYGLGALTAQGTSVAKYQYLQCKTKQPGNPYTPATGGYMILRGAMKPFKVRVGKIDSHQAEYQFPRVGMGAWTARLYLDFGFVQLQAGFVALDQDPDDTKLDGKELEVLLLRDDTCEPSAKELVTPSGYLKPRSTLPLVIPVKTTGSQVTVMRGEGTMRVGMTMTAKGFDGREVKIQQGGNKRYVTGLLLERVHQVGPRLSMFGRVGPRSAAFGQVGPPRPGMLGQADSQGPKVFRRIGLCQMYHSVWSGELKEEGRRGVDVVVV